MSSPTWLSSAPRSPYDAPRIFTASSDRIVTAGVGEPIQSARTRSPVLVREYRRSVLRESPADAVIQRSPSIRRSTL